MSSTKVRCHCLASPSGHFLRSPTIGIMTYCTNLFTGPISPAWTTRMEELSFNFASKKSLDSVGSHLPKSLCGSWYHLVFGTTWSFSNFASTQFCKTNTSPRHSTTKLILYGKSSSLSGAFGLHGKRKFDPGFHSCTRTCVPGPSF